MPNATKTVMSGWPDGVNDTVQAHLLKDTELAGARNMFWKNGRLETRKGYTLEATPETTTQTTADIVSSTTIGNNGWYIADDEFDGCTVEITAGLGSGQTRTITATAANGGNGYVTVATWDTTPDGTSSFKVYDIPIKSLYNYVQNNGTETLLVHTGGRVFQSTDGTTWAEIIIKDNEYNLSKDTVPRILTITAQMSYVTFRNKVFFFNGVDNVWSFDGSNTFVYDRDSEKDATGGGAGKTDLVDSSLSGSADDWWNNFKLYFLEVNGNFDITRDVSNYIDVSGTVEFTDAVPDQVASGDAYYMGPDIPLAAYACNCQNRIFALMRSDNQCHYSNVDDEMNWQPSLNYFEVETGVGQRHTGIAQYQGYLVIFKERSIIRYDVSNAHSMHWRREIINDRIGCAYHNSIQRLSIGGVDHLAWVSYDGICIMGPNWQVENVSKERLKVLFRNLQLPVFNYLQKVWTTTSDFETGVTESPANSIDQSGDEFTLAGATTTWENAGAGANGFSQTGCTLTGLKDTNGYLEIDFSEDIAREQNAATNDTWQDIGTAVIDAVRWQTFNPWHSITLSTIEVYLKKVGSPTDSVRMTLWRGPVSYGIVDVAAASIGSGGWISFDFTDQELASQTDWRIELSRTGSLDATEYYQWGHETVGDYTRGISDVGIAGLGDFLFKVKGTARYGTWVSNVTDTGYTTPAWGDFTATYTETLPYENAIYEIATSANGTDFGDYKEIWNGQHIEPASTLQHFKLQITLFTPWTGSSPTVDDVDVTYSIDEGMLTVDEYTQSGSFDHWGLFEVSRTMGTGTVKWEIRTRPAAGSWSSWENIIPGDPIQAASGDDSLEWKCTITADNASSNPTIQDVTANWVDWTAGGTLTAIGSSIIWDDRYWFAGAERDQTSNNIVIMLDDNKALWPHDIAMNGFAIFKNELYGGDNTGKIHKMYYGYNDNGAPYTTYAETKEIGIPNHKQIWRALHLMTEKWGSYDLAVDYVLDPKLRNPAYTTLGTVSLAGIGTLVERINFSTANKYTGTFLRLKFSTSTINNPFVIYGAIIYSFPYGLRGKKDAAVAKDALDIERVQV